MKKNILFVALLIFNFSFAYAQSPIINTIAGSGVLGYSGDGGNATAAEFYYPEDVAVDRTGTVYVGDVGNNCTRIISNTGVINTFAGNGVAGFCGDGGPATAAELWYPLGLSIDSSRNIYIADTYNERIRMVNSSGIINTVAGNGVLGFSGDGGPATAAELHFPTGAVADTAGNIYITDQYNNRIRKIDKSGIINTIAGTGVSGYSGDGGAATDAQVKKPYAIGVDLSGIVYIVDNNNSRIRIINKSGIISTIAGNGIAGYSGDGGPATDAELNNPASIAFDALGNIYISEALNNDVRIINSSGIINTYAGNAISGFSGDGGPATAAEMNQPYGVASDGLGNIYIGEYGNDRIRKVIRGVTGINNLSFIPNETSVYPNPNNGRFAIQLANSYQLMANSSLEIYNMLGEKIYSNSLSINNFPKGSIWTTLSIDLPCKSAGVYMYRLVRETGEQIANGKFIIE